MLESADQQRICATSALCRFAGLHSLYKGANKPRRIAVFRPSPGLRRPPTATAECQGFAPVAFAGQRGWTVQLEEGLATVTAISAEPTRRDFLYIATGAVGAVGAAATLVPLVAQMNPDASTIAAGAPI